MKALILNDLHVGVRRTGGTTPQSAKNLRAWLQSEIKNILNKHHDHHVIINGDALDGFTIDVQEMWELLDTFDEWIFKSKGDLYLAGGNHDFSAKGDKVSSFELMCRILKLAHPTRVHVYMDGLGKMWRDDVWVIPHCLNQDLFDLELDKASETMPEGSILFLHCNYDNKFAVHADHSLNLSKEAAKKLTDGGITLVIAHEHNKRVLRKGKIYITGNQFPTSVSDCLDDNGAKFAHILNEDNSIEPIQTWNNEGGFVEVEWTQLNEVQNERFIRVKGTATQASSNDVIETIAKFRSTSDAFVVSNAVAIEGLEGLDGFEELSLEQIKGFDVLAALLEKLEPKEQGVIEMLMKGREHV